MGIWNDGSRIEQRIDDAVRFQTRNPRARELIPRPDLPREHKAITGREMHLRGTVVRQRASIKARVERAVRKQAIQVRPRSSRSLARIITLDNQFSIRLHEHAARTPTRPSPSIEARIQRTAWFEAGDRLAGDAVDGGKEPGDHYAAVSLQRNVDHGGIQPGAEIKAGIEGAIGVQAHQVCAGRIAGISVKLPTHKNSAIGLDDQRFNAVIARPIGIEGGIVAPVAVEPGESRPRGEVHVVEITRNQ